MPNDKLIENESNSKKIVMSCGAVRFSAIDFAGDGAVAVVVSPAIAGDGLPSDGAAAERERKLFMSIEEMCFNHP
jgi:hypothetical protein